MKLDRSLSLVLATWAALSSAVSYGIGAAGGNGQRNMMVVYSTVGKVCADALISAVVELVEGPNAKVAFTSLRNFQYGMVVTGLSNEQAVQTTRGLNAVLTDAQAPRVLKQVSASLLAAETDDSLLGVCAVGQDCRMLRGTPTVHVSADHPFTIRSFFGGQSGSKLSWPSGAPPIPTAGVNPWQGFIIQLKPHPPQDMGTLVENLDSIFHEAGYFDAMSRLVAWSLYVQQGGKPHARIAQYISSDGKSIDIGFVHLLMESRATRSELEAQDVIMRLIKVAEVQRRNLRERVQGRMLMRAHESILDYGSTSETVLKDFAVSPDRLYDLAEELIDLVDWRE